jgi:hypothetical protein
MRLECRRDAAGAVGKVAITGRPFATYNSEAVRKALGLLADKLEQRAAEGRLHVLLSACGNTI